MKVALFAFLFFLSGSLLAQRPMLSSERPIEFSKNFNNGNFIIDYLLTEKAVVNLYLKHEEMEKPIYLLQMKAVEAGQYELEVNKNLMKEGTTYAIMEWNGNAFEASYYIEEEEASPEDVEEKD